MYPVERTVSETREPFHKQQLFLLLGVHVSSEYDLKMYSLPVSFPWEHIRSLPQAVAIPPADLSLWAGTFLCPVATSE